MRLRLWVLKVTEDAEEAKHLQNRSRRIPTGNRQQVASPLQLGQDGSYLWKEGNQRPLLVAHCVRIRHRQRPAQDRSILMVPQCHIAIKDDEANLACQIRQSPSQSVRLGRRPTPILVNERSKSWIE